MSPRNRFSPLSLGSTPKVTHAPVRTARSAPSPRYNSLAPALRGVGPSTEFYKCPHRDSCLIANDIVPQEMYCSENHTGIMCSRCYHRYTNCGRGGRGRLDTCPEPGYLDRGNDAMFFAFVARHCERCPSGRAVLVPLVITIGVGIGAIIIVALIVVVQLHNVEQMVKKLAANHIEHNAAGPIVRLLLNWLQATALLSTIKLTPPDAVKDVSVAADYAQGINTDWYFIACTLRLNVWMEFAFQLAMPIVGAILPAVLVLTTPGVKRGIGNLFGRLKNFAAEAAKYSTLAETHAQRKRERVASDATSAGIAMTAFGAGIALSAFGSEEADGETTEESIDLADSEHSGTIDLSEEENDDFSSALVFVGHGASTLADDGSRVQIPLLRPLAAIPAERVEGTGERTFESAASSDLSSATDDDTDVEAQLKFNNEAASLGDGLRPFDARAGWFWNISYIPLRLLRKPALDSLGVRFALPRGATFRAEERRAVRTASVQLEGGASITPSSLADCEVVHFLRLAGKWGEGWVPMMIDGIRVVDRVPASSVVTTFEYEAGSLAPADKCMVPRPAQSRRRRRGVDRFSDVVHRFRALEALCPEEGITRDVIEHVFPAKTSVLQLNEFMATFDKDGDGRLSWEEYRGEADDVVASTWRYRGRAGVFSRGIWGRFASADADLDGTLNADEIAAFLPITLSAKDAAAWMVRFDRSGAHGRITISDVVALEHAAVRDDVVTILGASVSMSVFVVYIRTSKAIMTMFSTETIEDIPYLKNDIGRPAYTNTHIFAIVVAAIYGAVFVIGIPIGGLYILFLNRDRLKQRRIQSVFGFLFVGYKDETFFWEFTVLLRKICFLAVALFWEDAFLQSVVGLFVIILSIIIHMACWPYQQRFLNIVELMSLFCLFSLVVLSILLWYVQQPGKTKYLVVYETAATLVLFFEYGLVIALLLGRYIYCMLRESSAAVTKAFPYTRGFFVRAARFELWAHSQFHKQRPGVAQSELWTFISADERAALDAAEQEETLGFTAPATPALAKKKKKAVRKPSLCSRLSGLRSATRDVHENWRAVRAKGITRWTDKRRAQSEALRALLRAPMSEEEYFPSAGAANIPRSAAARHVVENPLSRRESIQVPGAVNPFASPRSRSSSDSESVPRARRSL